MISVGPNISLILYVARNTFIETEILIIEGIKSYKNIGNIKSIHYG